MTFRSAHAFTTGGGSIEEIALAVGIVFLGLAFMVQKAVDRRVSIGLVVLGILTLVASFTIFKPNTPSGRTITVQGQQFPVSQLQGALTAICSARDVVTSDIDEANRTFFDRAHIPLHAMAAAVEDEDRSMAGMLLEAKNRVERGFVKADDPEQLEVDLEALMKVTVTTLHRLSISASQC